MSFADTGWAGRRRSTLENAETENGIYDPVPFSTAKTGHYRLKQGLEKVTKYQAVRVFGKDEFVASVNLLLPVSFYSGIDPGFFPMSHMSMQS
jgi:hypothetical protein